MRKLIAVLAIVAVFGLATAEAGNLDYTVAAGDTVTDSNTNALGTGWLRKYGDGTLIMTGDTTCATAAIYAGTLVLSGSGDPFVSGSINANASGIVIDGGTFLLDAGATFNPGAALYWRISLLQGTIGGSGTFNIHGAYYKEPDDPGSYNDAPVTVGADRTIAPGMPGEGPGTMTFDWMRNGLDFAEGGTYAWDLDGTGQDLLDVSNLKITATSGDQFTIKPYTSDTTWGPGEDHTWTIATGGISGFSADKFVIDDTNFVGAGPSATWSLALDGDDLNLSYEIPPIPEPAGLGLLGVGLLALRRRRS